MKHLRGMTMLLALGLIAFPAAAADDEPLADDYASGEFGRVRHAPDGAALIRSEAGQSQPADDLLNAPVFPGDTIRLVLTVNRVDDEPSRRSGLVVFDARVLNHEDKVVSEGEWQTRILRDRDAVRAASQNTSDAETQA